MNPDASLEIIIFRPEHADELVAMWRASFEHGVGITDPHPIEEQRDFLFKKIAPENEIRVAVADGRIIGFIAASRESIAALYVDVDHLGCGIGTRLLEWAKDQADGGLYLYTFERNTRAQLFYERHGFTVIERGFEEEWQLADIKYRVEPFDGVGLNESADFGRDSANLIPHMHHFKKPLIVTGIAIMAALLLGIGGSTWIYFQKISDRKKNERVSMLGTGLGFTAMIVSAPFWFGAAARVGKERREARERQK